MSLSTMLEHRGLTFGQRTGGFEAQKICILDDHSLTIE
jgi:hypothetical protein